MEMDYIWMNGKMVEEKDANISVLTHGLHYGSSFFEGLRAYKTHDGRTAIFRVEEHIERLIDTAKIYKTEIPYSKEEMIQAICDVIKANKFEECYIRPLAYRGKAVLGIEPRKCPVDLSISAWVWGAYLGEEGLEKGVKVQVSSWRRLAPDTIPTLAKAGGNYLSSQLIKMEAIDNGYDEGIALDYQGNLSEASGANLFIIKNGEILTPPLSASSLAGITRNSIITLAEEMGLTVKECGMPREFLYLADEIFLTGSAAEITPVAEVDKVKVGSGTRGPITKKIQDEFAKLVSGQNESHLDWLYFVD